MKLLIQLIGLFICMAGTLFFSATETAITSVSLSTWDRLRQTDSWMGGAYQTWSSEPSLVLATLLFGNTFCSLGASVLASIFLRPLGEWIGLPTNIFVLFSAFLSGTFILVAGEILPKLYAQQSQSHVLRVTLRPAMATVRLLRPLMIGLSSSADRIKRLVSTRPPEPLVTADELRQVLNENQSEGLAPTARRMLSNLMSFDQARVEHVMVPRAHMVAVRLEQNSEKMFTSIIRSGFSRLPVYFGHLDNIVGVIYAKDLLVEWRSSGLLILEDLLRPVFRIAPDASLASLLLAFRQGQHMAIVTDAAGATRGVVTIEDVVETIVGDIADEFDQPVHI